ncbi:MAG: hypothetical protein ACW98D_12030, partial [Promethearchaeota archaeon]
FIENLNSILGDSGIDLDLDSILFTDTSGRNLDTIQTELNDGDKFNIQELGSLRAGEITLDRWLVRIENKVLSFTHVSEAVKQDIISSIRQEFNEYNSKSGWSAENLFYREVRLLIFKIGEVLLKEGIIDLNIPNNINEFINNKYDCKRLYERLKNNPSSIPSLGVASGLHSFMSEIEKTIDLKYANIKDRLDGYISPLFNEYESIIRSYSQGKDLLESHPNSPRKDLIADILACSPVLQGVQHMTALSYLLFGDRTYLDSAFLQEERGRIFSHVEPRGLFFMESNVEQWTTSLFDKEHLTIDELSLERLKRDVLSTIRIFMVDYDKDGFQYVSHKRVVSGKAFSRIVLEKKMDFVFACWRVAAVFKNNPKIDIDAASEFFNFHDLFRGISRGNDFDGKTLKSILLQLNKLSAQESTNVAPLMSEIPISLSEELSVLNDAIEALAEYMDVAGIYFESFGRKGFAPQPPTISKSLDILLKEAKYSKLVALLDKAVETFDQFKRIRYSSKGISTQFNKRLVGVLSSIKATFIDTFINTDKLATLYKRGDTNNPDIVRELIRASQGKGTGAGGSISHEELVNIVKKLKCFLGAEVPLHIDFSTASGDRTFAGQPDYFLYDEEKGVIYIADYKPDLSVSDSGHLSFVNSIPQIAAYALILQELTGIKVECIIFNSGGAMTFDPSNVLAPINAFMQANVPGWVAPWKDFSTYLK